MLDEKRTWLYKNGVMLRADQIGAKDDTYRIYGFNSEFLGLLQTDVKENKTKRIKNFY